MNAEALSLASGFGLDLDSTLDVLYGTTAVNGQLKIAWPAKILSDDKAPGFTIDLAHKDLSSGGRGCQQPARFHADGSRCQRGVQPSTFARLWRG